MTAVTPYRSDLTPGRDGFAQLAHAEWTKFRTVRGWLIAVIIAILVTAGIGVLYGSVTTVSCAVNNGKWLYGEACMTPLPPAGPGGELVIDRYMFVHQPLAGDGSITVRLTSMTGLLPGPNQMGPGPSSAPGSGAGSGLGLTQPGLEPWAKAGILITPSLSQGSAYAAMMVAAGHGVRMQWNYTGDTPGQPGAVGPANPRWLRLTRAGDVITGYDSADGTHWTEVGSVTLPGLPATVQAGLFATSPDETRASAAFAGGNSIDVGPTEVTAVFDHVTLSRSSLPWRGDYVGAVQAGIGEYHQAGGQFTVTGAGDIAPRPYERTSQLGPAVTLTDYLLGTFMALIAVAVVATMFITGEYRRGLIRTTLAASPRRGRVLAAKAIVIGAVAFVAGVTGATGAVVIGGAIVRHRDYYQWPASTPTEVRVIIGTGLLLAVAAILTLAVGTVLRRGVGAVAIVIVAIVLPYFVSVTRIAPATVGEWLLRITPAAGFAIQQPYPAYSQVTATYLPVDGYFPLAEWSGFAVLCAWAVLALAAAAYLLRRRDA